MPVPSTTKDVFTRITIDGVFTSYLSIAGYVGKTCTVIAKTAVSQQETTGRVYS